MNANPHRLGPAAAATAVLLGTASPAWAFFNDRLQVFVAETVRHESNLFRISDSADANATIGSSERSDTWYNTQLGFRLNTPVSRQRIVAGYSWGRIKYDRFTALDHTDRNGYASWLWQAGDRFNGEIGYTETRTIASFTNFVGAQANPLTTRVATATANYRVNPHWELQAAGTETQQRNALAVRQANDVDVTSAQVGIGYISTRGNRIGVNVRQDEGRYPNRELIGAVSVRHDYVQRSVGASTDWTITAKSHLAARIDRVQRDHDQFSSRDFKGATFRVAYDWLPTAKTSISFIGLREIASSEDVQTNFVLVKGIAVTPSYAFSEKIRLTGSLSSNIRDYRGDPSIPGASTPFAGREDRVRAAVVTLTYLPTRALTMFLSAHRETRSSNRALTDYDNNMIEVSARLTF